MDAKTFFNLVERMRHAQKEYFKTKDKNILIISKRLESEVDTEIKRVNDILIAKCNQNSNSEKLF